MTKKILNFSTAIIIIFTFFAPFCRAQQVITTPDIDTADLARIRAGLQQQRKERDMLTQHFDSLFLKKAYKQIIRECDGKSPAAHLAGVVKYNLIAAHYFAGDIELSRSLIEKELLKYDSSGIGASTLLSENYTGYLYFLSRDENWQYIEKRVKEIAMRAAIAEKDTEKEKEQQLFGFFLADQKNRLFYDYTAENKSRLYKFENYKTEQAFEEKVEAVCKEVFAFYQEEGKLFSKNEVGELHYIQLVFLLHDSDPKRRAYYLELLSNAVTAGVFPIDKKIDFLIVSELIKAGWENMTTIIEEQESKMRIQYNLPGYRFSLVM